MMKNEFQIQLMSIYLTDDSDNWSSGDLKWAVHSASNGHPLNDRDNLMLTLASHIAFLEVDPSHKNAYLTHTHNVNSGETIDCLHKNFTNTFQIPAIHEVSIRCSMKDIDGGFNGGDDDFGEKTLTFKSADNFGIKNNETERNLSVILDGAGRAVFNFQLRRIISNDTARFTSEELTQIKAFLENYDYDKTGFIDPDDGMDLEYARSISVYWEECFDAFMMVNADTNKDGKFHIDEVMAYFAALEDF